MLAAACVLLVAGIGALLYVADLFGYSRSVKNRIDDLNSGKMLDSNERQELLYFKFTRLARYFGLLCLFLGLVVLLIAYVGNW
ncbi:hypothetical protein [Pseudomonas gingeri]|uniref:hypothetical protein n=1 Tax=Pseudomonas gingeri TaxID=117681 RepID=UPI0015A45389|nr:hypothetical protein [Pseudomonas gingeri]NWA08441.1 hypothetical protein [Pseudomonas gingeri]